MIAKRIPSILPPLPLAEAIETTKVYRVCGLLEAKDPFVWERPFRTPHHTRSDAGLLGGTAHPSLGEVSLAHHRVLFLDELPEFRRSTLEVMRQPLEVGKVTIFGVTDLIGKGIVARVPDDHGGYVRQRTSSRMAGVIALAPWRQAIDDGGRNRPPARRQAAVKQSERALHRRQRNV